MEIKLPVNSWREIESTLSEAIKLAQDGYIESETDYYDYLSEQPINIVEVKG